MGLDYTLPQALVHVCVSVETRGARENEIKPRLNVHRDAQLGAVGRTYPRSGG